MSSTSRLNLVYLVESDILQHSRLRKLSFRRDGGYFAGRAGIIRALNFIVAVASTLCMLQGYNPETLGANTERDAELIRMMKTDKFTGYGNSILTLASIVLGLLTMVISLIFVLLLYFFMEVRCDLLWEKVNQKAHVLACVVSVAAAFLCVLSIQRIQADNCRTTRCEADMHNTRATQFEEAFYPPYFIYHYAAFVLYLVNAMLYSIASRIWLRNED